MPVRIGGHEKFMADDMFERGKSVLDKFEIKKITEINSSESKVSTMSQRNSKNPRGQAMIGPSIVINGKVSGDEDLTIEGTVEGSIDLPNQNVLTKVLIVAIQMLLLELPCFQAKLFVR